MKIKVKFTEKGKYIETTIVVEGVEKERELWSEVIKVRLLERFEHISLDYKDAEIWATKQVYKIKRDFFDKEGSGNPLDYDVIIYEKV